MLAAIPPPSPSTVERIDQRVFLRGVRWEDYESLLAMRGESSGTRLTYLKGELELMTPSADHEDLKTRLARLIDSYAEELGVELEGYGFWTVKSEAEERGAEADECYVIGLLTRKPERPDIAVEVIWTWGGIDKLEVCGGLGVPEVWFWKDGGLRLFTLQEHTYLPTPRSRLLPDLDPELIARCMGEPSQTRAVRALRRALRA